MPHSTGNKETCMARWKKRLAAFEYAGMGHTKGDELIALGHFRAKKEEGGRRATVYVDLDSIDEFFENLPPARGLMHSRHKRRAARAKDAANDEAA
jgi:hypothetical protein